MPGGTVPADPERWGERSVAELSTLLERATRSLQSAIEEVAMDEAAYHRTFWTTWQRLDPTMSIAAMTRACETAAKHHRGEVILKTALMEAKRARRDGLAVVLAAKS